MMIANCKYCGKDFEQKTTSVEYCSYDCRNHDRLTVQQCKSTGVEFKSWKKNTLKYPEFYCYSRFERIKIFGHYEKCYICGKLHDKQGMTCSHECAWEMKKETWTTTQGASHNLSRNAKSRIEWGEKLFKERGVTNVFELQEVKTKCRESWGCYNPSQMLSVKKAVRKSRENNKLVVPLQYIDEYLVYHLHVSMFTNHNLKFFGDEKFGKNWQESKKDQRLSLDHVYSISRGYLDEIPAHIIGSIFNLELVPHNYNSSKGNRCGITKEELLEKYSSFDKNLEQYFIETVEEDAKRKLEYKQYIISKLNENKDSKETKA